MLSKLEAEKVKVTYQKIKMYPEKTMLVKIFQKISGQRGSFNPNVVPVAKIVAVDVLDSFFYFFFKKPQIQNFFHQKEFGAFLSSVWKFGKSNLFGWNGLEPLNQ